MVFRDTFPIRDNISAFFGLLTTVLSPSARRYFQQSWLNCRMGLNEIGIKAQFHKSNGQLYNSFPKGRDFQD